MSRNYKGGIIQMKSATKTMYLIGKIFTIIEAIGSCIAAVLGVVAIAANKEVYRQAIADGYSKFESPAQVREFGIALLVGALVVFIIQLVVLALAKRARKATEKDEKDTKPHVVMIVIGVFSNVFYLLGGVFGVIAIGDTEK